MQPCRCRHRGQTEGPELPQPRTLGLLELQLCAGAAVVSPSPGKWKGQLCCLLCLGAGSPAAPGLAWLRAGMARRAASAAPSARDRGLVPLPSPPCMAAWPVVPRRLSLQGGSRAAWPSGEEHLQGRRALLRRDTGRCCAGTQGTAGLAAALVP